MPDYPIYPKTYDLIAYLIPVTQSFPKSQRFVLAKRIQDTVLDFGDLLILARKVNVDERRGVLRRADAKLEMLRMCLRLRWNWGSSPSASTSTPPRWSSRWANCLGIGVRSWSSEVPGT